VERAVQKNDVPSYVLPEYVLGLKGAEPGWEKWTLKSLVTGLDLDWVTGRVETTYGTVLLSVYGSTTWFSL
jgi:hypothetical protein